MTEMKKGSASPVEKKRQAGSDILGLCNTMSD
jgi:hypothetical protein